MNTTRTTSQWREFVEGCLDFRPADGVYRIARDMFTEPALFELEMEMIFEKSWIYACHESEIANPNDFITMRAGPYKSATDGPSWRIHNTLNRMWSTPP